LHGALYTGRRGTSIRFIKRNRLAPHWDGFRAAASQVTIAAKRGICAVGEALSLKTDIKHILAGCYLYFWTFLGDFFPWKKGKYIYICWKMMIYL
jgi:hypothetical protein